MLPKVIRWNEDCNDQSLCSTLSLCLLLKMKLRQDTLLCDVLCCVMCDVMCVFLLSFNLKQTLRVILHIEQLWSLTTLSATDSTHSQTFQSNYFYILSKTRAEWYHTLWNETHNYAAGLFGVGRVIFTSVGMLSVLESRLLKTTAGCNICWARTLLLSLKQR